MKSNTSEQTQLEALKVAKSTSRPGQTKDQTKLIAKGVEKGIAEYKKQQKSKARERDKAKKKTSPDVIEQTEVTAKPKTKSPALLPWSLLTVSWVGFVAWMLFTNYV